MSKYAQKLFFLLLLCHQLIALALSVKYPFNDSYTMLISGGYRPLQKIHTKYLVSLRHARPIRYFGENHFCAGTIIGQSLIVTAAHCIQNSQQRVTRPRQLVVIAGSSNRLLKTNKTARLAVETVVTHEQFRRHWSPDIALLRLKKPIPANNENIEVLEMQDEEMQPGANCTTIGWGKLFFQGPYAAEAVYVDLSILSHQECRNRFPNQYSAGMLCAANPKDWKKDACRGDSGGPLICKGKLAGIVSWGTRCGQQLMPLVFSDIHYYRDWIMSNNGSALSKVHVLILIYSILIINYALT